MSGAGAAGTAICKYLVKMGVKNVIVSEMNKIINKDETYPTPSKNELAQITNKQNIKGNLADAMIGADVFVGVSAGNIVSKEMVASMAKDAIVFAMANPIPEISYQDALDAGAKIVGTGSSKNPNLPTGDIEVVGENVVILGKCCLNLSKFNNVEHSVSTLFCINGCSCLYRYECIDLACGSHFKQITFFHFFKKNNLWILHVELANGLLLRLVIDAVRYIIVISVPLLECIFFSFFGWTFCVC